MTKVKKRSIGRLVLFSSIVVTVLFVAVCLAIISKAFFQSKDIVSVKYRSEPVDLSTFEKLDTSKSSFINGAWYSMGDDYLILKLNSTYYHYCDFPSSKWVELKNAVSYGEYYNTSIQGKYYCTKNTLLPGDTCLAAGIGVEEDYLNSEGYFEASDHSWQNTNGEYPTSEIEHEGLRLLNEAREDCIYSFNRLYK